ncbi:phosphotransferase family protein [Spiroplasma monobiae]|uniref:Choline kinase n=1 Tax=Spiroplasma monobiae MQ-1 TaxID=1336748 RepID=A0A2K9LU41_SPISQ|nr:phosphotransferase [Spiroplasma monobiae]AUM62587.1 hypothetical protein SMONO_v1c03380 [Spiroplasma monobiae MQ-1]
MKFQGFTNKIHLINNIIIKESDSFHDFYLDKRNEFVFLEELSHMNQDYLLKPLEFNLNNNKLISKYKYLSEFKTLSEIIIDEKIINLVIDNISEMHKININNSKIKSFKYFDFLINIKSQLENDLNFLDDYIKEVKDIDGDFNGLDLVLSHNDLVPGNILVKENKVIFIDYDYVTLNNNLFDLASFITETLNENEELVEYFIEQCFKSDLMKKEDLKLLNKMIKYQDLLWTIWAKVMYEKKKESIFNDIFEDKLNRLKNRKTY